jgi:anti-sigma factor RsiW
MKIDETTLLAYVEQELDAARRAQVDAACAASPELQAQLAALQASRLPYAAAFANQALPEMPAALAQQLATMHSAAASAIADRADRAERPALPPINATPSRRSWLVAGGAVAASFVAGFGLRAAMQGLGKQPSQTAQAASPWVDAVANYQAMYTRATVEGAAQAPAQATAVLQQFAIDAAAPGGKPRVAIPDLSADGLVFKRAQRLAFGQRALLQIAYLPSTGMPAALCVLASDSSANTPPKVMRLHGLAMVTWDQAGLAYALASDWGDAQALTLGQKIAAGQNTDLVRV